MLTARVEEHDRIQGFGEGADDYLVKPFAAAELLGRVRAVLRRTSGAPAAVPRVAACGSLRLDAQAQEAFWNDAALDLTPSEFAILEVLTRAAGRVVSRDELSAVLHQRETTPYERSLDVHVSHCARSWRRSTLDHPHGAGSRLLVFRRQLRRDPMRSLSLRILLASLGTVLASLAAFLITFSRWWGRRPSG